MCSKILVKNIGTGCRCNHLFKSIFMDLCFKGFTINLIIAGYTYKAPSGPNINANGIGRIDKLCIMKVGDRILSQRMF